MRRPLAFVLCLALAPFAWGEDEDKQAEKELKGLRDRIMKRVSERLDKEFARIRAEVKELLDEELGLGKKEGERPEKKAPPREEKKEKPASDEKRPGWLGVQLGTDEESGLPSVEGVFPDTPAEKAGLKEGDLFVKLDGKDVESVQDLIAAIQEAGAGAKLSLRVRRSGEEKDVAVELEERPEELEGPREDEEEDLGEDDK